MPIFCCTSAYWSDPRPVFVILSHCQLAGGGLRALENPSSVARLRHVLEACFRSASAVTNAAIIEAGMDRRSLLKSAVLLAGARAGFPLELARAASEGGQWRHGLSRLGDLRYPPNFPRFDYVNAGAPKSGEARIIALGTFDTFNMAAAGMKGVLAQGIDLVYDTLLTPSLDEPASYYGLLAEAVRYPDNIAWIAFRLRSGARWHDGRPITPEDVIFSFETFKKLNPQSADDFSRVKPGERTGEHEVTFHFTEPGVRELPKKLGELAILPKHWWEGVDDNGKQRNVEESLLEPPLGSGPYRLKEFVPGRSLVYGRVEQYWARAVNVNVGRHNFDQLRFEYFRDTTVAVEAFKASAVDWRVENSAKNWASSYDFPAVSEKRVILEEFPINNIGIMQAFAFNIRRNKFSDPRVRRAFNHALGFEELNKQLFFGQYKRISSYFENTELASSGVPQGKELKLLEEIRDQVPPQVFTTAFQNPRNDNVGEVRQNLREALRLLSEAGYEVREQQLVDRKTHEPFTVELLTNSPLFERVYLYYKPSLEKLGISVAVRTVDSSQYENRLRTWDFDVITFAWGETLVPGNELHGYFGSETADQPGSNNVVGIKNPAIDKMIHRVVHASDREDLIAACHALDRILLWNHYVVPQWSYAKLRTARWNRFSRPENLPKYGMAAFPDLWWWDADKAAKAGGRQ
jgi:microcin C transport system substrate-binding protein